MGKRIAWIDIARGIGIILVVYGHSLSSGPLRSVIYSFHMPLFFFLSGMVYRYKPEERLSLFLTKNAKNILVPYIFFAVLSFLLWIPTKHPPLHDILWQFGSIFYGNGNNGLLAFNNLLWFLPCLFIARVGLYLVTHTVVNRLQEGLVLVVCSVLGYLYSVTFPHIKLPFGFETALTAIVFVGVGYLWYSSREGIAIPYKSISQLLRNRFFMLVLSCVGLGLCIVVALVSFQLYGLQVDMRQDTLHNYFLFYGAAFLGITATLFLSMSIDTNKVLEYLGKQSLVIFAWHYLAFPYVSKLLFYANLKPMLKVLPLFISPIVYSLLSVIIVLLLAIPIQRVWKYTLLKTKN